MRVEVGPRAASSTTLRQGFQNSSIVMIVENVRPKKVPLFSVTCQKNWVGRLVGKIFFFDFFFRSRNLKSLFKPISSIIKMIFYCKYMSHTQMLVVVFVAFVGFQ